LKLDRICWKGDWYKRGLFALINIRSVPVAFWTDSFRASLIIEWTLYIRPGLSPNLDSAFVISVMKSVPIEFLITLFLIFSIQANLYWIIDSTFRHFDCLRRSLLSDQYHILHILFLRSSRLNYWLPFANFFYFRQSLFKACLPFSLSFRFALIFIGLLVNFTVFFLFFFLFVFRSVSWVIRYIFLHFACLRQSLLNVWSHCLSFFPICENRDWILSKHSPSFPVCAPRYWIWRVARTDVEWRDLSGIMNLNLNLKSCD
jgi:hypothetical protein